MKQQLGDGMKKIAAVTLGLALTILVGCESMDKTMSGGASSMPDEAKRKELVGKFPEFNAAEKEKFLRGTPWIGMSQAHYEALMGGPATKSQRKLSAAGEEDIQVYVVRVGDWKT